MISDKELKEIYDMLINTTIPIKHIAAHYNISFSTVTRINTGERRSRDGYTYPLRMTSKQRNKLIRQDIETGYSDDAIREKYNVTSVVLRSIKYNTKRNKG